MINHAMFNEIIGKNIKHHVARKRADRIILAEKAGITAYKLSQYENGTHPLNINTLGKICHYLNVPLSHLLFNEKAENTKNDQHFRHIDALFSDLSRTPQATDIALYAIVELAYTLY